MPFTAKGKCSFFGGPEDMGVAPDEGLAFIYTVEDKSDLFLSYQPEGTTGLARRLNPAVPYVACRWPYNSSNKAQWRDVLLTEMAMITNPANGKFVKAYPSDWGPHEEETGGRVADLSEKVMEKLGLKTDDVCEVIFPYTTRGEAELPRYKSIAISSGHSTKCQGANGNINEVEEATKVTDLLAEKLRERGVEVETFHDTVSTDKNECLDRICDWHNDQSRELDISVHFNASQETNKPVGCEVFWVTQEVLASE